MGGLGAGLGGPGPGQIPPPPGGLGSGLLALGSVAGALVGHPYNQYGNQMKEEKDDRDRTVIILFCFYFKSLCKIKCTLNNVQDFLFNSIFYFFQANILNSA